MEETPAPSWPADTTRTRMPPTPPRHGPQGPSMAGLLRQGQIDQGTIVSQTEADLRDLINTSAQLTAAAENIRLQRRVLWLTIVSVIVAIIAATAAVAALHISGGTPAPAPSAHPTASRHSGTLGTSSRAS